MRKSRFTDEQMVAIVPGGGSRSGSGCCQAARCQRTDDLHLAQAPWTKRRRAASEAA